MTRAITDEQEWRTFLGDRELAPFDTTSAHRVVVVAAHPDDETLGAGNIIQALHAAGAKITLVVASDGEAAFPALGTADRAALGAQRRAELSKALATLGLGDLEIHLLGFPDSALTEHQVPLTERLTELLRDADCVLVPWPGDPHPDHGAAGRAGLAARPPHAHCWSYPIWMWHWSKPGDPSIPWSRAAIHRAGSTHRERKQRAVSAFTSQLARGPHGEDPIVDEFMLTHLDRDHEVLFREPPTVSAPIDRFARLYGAATCPWGAAESWYERRKRSLTMDSLPRERYRRALEPACGTGELTRELTARCAEVIAFDPVPAAVHQARHAAPGARVEIGALPDRIPSEGPVDLLVFSEILYYLDDRDLVTSLDRLVNVVEPGGHLIATHWRPWAPEAPRDGAAAHRELLDRTELAVLVEHIDDEFLLHVLRRR